MFKLLQYSVLFLIAYSFSFCLFSCQKDNNTDNNSLKPVDSLPIDTVPVDTVPIDTTKPWVDTTTTPFYIKQPKLPFPQNAVYASGVNLPTEDEGTRTQKVINFYKEWKKRYLRTFTYGDSIRGNDTLKYVYYTLEHKVGDAITCSEAHGFGMLISVLMAGADTTAYDDFIKLYNWYKLHPSAISPELMSWQQNSKGKNSGGSSTATDGDLDIAYALLLAHYQWGSDGIVNFLEEAKKDIEAIYNSDISKKYKTIELGDWVNSGNYAKSTRFCDHMLDHLNLFGKITGDAKWTEVIDTAYSCINQAAHDSTGLLPDFAYFNGTAFVPCAANFLEGPYDGDYYYNSCRAPWRIAMNYIVYGDNRANEVLLRLNRWLIASTGINPSKIKGGYRLNGTPLNSWSDMSFTAPFGIAAMVDAENQAWLDAMWNHIIKTKISDEAYFGNSIKMLCLITMNGNWWVPANL